MRFGQKESGSNPLPPLEQSRILPKSRATSQQQHRITGESTIDQRKKQEVDLRGRKKREEEPELTFPPISFSFPSFLSFASLPSLFTFFSVLQLSNSFFFVSAVFWCGFRAFKVDPRGRKNGREQGGTGRRRRINRDASKSTMENAQIGLVRAPDPTPAYSLRGGRVWNLRRKSLGVLEAEEKCQEGSELTFSFWGRSPTQSSHFFPLPFLSSCSTTTHRSQVLQNSPFNESTPSPQPKITSMSAIPSPPSPEPAQQNGASNDELASKGVSVRGSEWSVSSALLLGSFLYIYIFQTLERAKADLSAFLVLGDLLLSMVNSKQDHSPTNSLSVSSRQRQAEAAQAAALKPSQQQQVQSQINDAQEHINAVLQSALKTPNGGGGTATTVDQQQQPSSQQPPRSQHNLNPNSAPYSSPNLHLYRPYQPNGSSNGVNSYQPYSPQMRSAVPSGSSNQNGATYSAGGYEYYYPTSPDQSQSYSSVDSPSMGGASFNPYASVPAEGFEHFQNGVYGSPVSTHRGSIGGSNGLGVGAMPFNPYDQQQQQGGGRPYWMMGVPGSPAGGFSPQMGSNGEPKNSQVSFILLSVEFEPKEQGVFPNPFDPSRARLVILVVGS